MPPYPTENARMGLPLRPFLYTLDQVASFLQVNVRTLRSNYLHFAGRTVGAQNRDTILCRNIAPAGSPPEWRVAERELIRWLKRCGFRIYVEREIVTGTNTDPEGEPEDE